MRMNLKRLVQVSLRFRKLKSHLIESLQILGAFCYIVLILINLKKNPDRSGFFLLNLFIDFGYYLTNARQ